MRLKSKIAEILKDKSGVSLMFVLGIMMFLLAIGASLLAAASANIGANVRQNEYNRVIVLGDSIHRSIMHSLQADPEDENSLANRLAWIVYETPDIVSQGSIELELDFDTPGNDDIPDYMAISITLSFLFREVIITPATEYVPEIPAFTDTDGIPVEAVPEVPGMPETAAISADMLVTVVIEADGIIRDGSRFITSQAYYEYRGGLLTDDPDGNIATRPNPPASDLYFATDGYGTWSMISYEIIESQVDNG